MNKLVFVIKIILTSLLFLFAPFLVVGALFIGVPVIVIEHVIAIAKNKESDFWNEFPSGG